MLAKVLAPATVGMEGTLVEVECDITNGLPSLVIVGLGNQAINEARDRVRGALRNSQLVLPPKRITLNLAPADLPKDGTAYDLSIAVAVLVASGQLETAPTSLFVGELALDGALRPVNGVLAYAQLAARHHVPHLFVPVANAKEAALIEGVSVFGVNNLLELYGHLAGLSPLTPEPPVRLSGQRVNSESVPDFASVYGQAEAKRALEIAAAGGHNVLLSGPPGSGKTMVSRALIGILPPPSMEEIIETSMIHSLAGKVPNGVLMSRPFRNPHHTASDIALIGGGRVPRPGEISLSHRGVLFLDELPEFRRDVLEVLRQPLEDGVVTIARASGTLTFPAEFILVAAQNPCSCGYAGDPVKSCSCSQAQIGRYQRKVSGPLLDRIDLVVDVHRVEAELLQAAKPSEPSAQIAKRVLAARQRQHQRSGGVLNARLSNAELKKHANISKGAKEVLDEAIRRLNLSARSYIRTLKVARTIADLEGSRIIKPAQISEAIHYRPSN